MNNIVYNTIENIGRLLIKTPEIKGIQNVKNDIPAVFVANHAGVYGPVIIKLFFPFNVLPWVIHNITDRQLCADYLKINFFENKLGWHRFISKPASYIVGKICVAINRHIGSIPVYRMDRRIFRTIELSVDALKNNNNLVIYIDDDLIEADALKRGFINVAKAFYNRYRVAIIFYPVRIYSDRKEIIIHPGIQYDPDRQYRQERLRIKDYLNNCLRCREHY
ncbi:MAG: hypothetical protein GX024_03895 [Clostridiales bacterium]|nr:hypothetical protein [Clostridiales bacterium]